MVKSRLGIREISRAQGTGGRFEFYLEPEKALPLAGEKGRNATVSLHTRSSNNPGWKGSSASCSALKKSFFVLPRLRPSRVWQS